MLQILADRRHHVVLDPVGPERVVVDVPDREQFGDRLEVFLIRHAESDLLEVRPVQVMLVEIGHNLIGRAMLREIVPRLAIDRAGLFEYMESERIGVGQQLLVIGHMDRIMRVVALGREVEVVFDRLRVIGLKVEVQRPRILPAGDRNRALGYLQQHAELLTRRGRIRQNDLATVNRMDEELVGDELVDLLVVDVNIAVAVAEEVLADQNRCRLGDRSGLLDLLMEDDHRAAGLQHHLGALELDVMFFGFGGHVQQGQGEHHLGEVPRCLGQMNATEGLGRLAPGIVFPKGIDGDQRGVLLLDWQLIVVVLDPFLGFVELLVELSDAPAFVHIGVEVSGRSAAGTTSAREALLHFGQFLAPFARRGSVPVRAEGVGFLGRVGHRLRLGCGRRERIVCRSRWRGDARSRSLRFCGRQRQTPRFVGLRGKLDQPVRVVRVQDAALQRRVEQQVKSLDIGRDQVEQVRHMTRCMRLLALDSLGQ